MAFISITEAAQLADVSRGTIYNKIKSGELSRTSDGIDTAELARVFGSLSLRQNRQDSSFNDASASIQAEQSISSDLLALVTEQRQELADLRERLEDASERLQEHREKARALIAPETFDAAQRNWETQIKERQAEIDAARQEAADIRRKADEELAAMQNRGLIDRLFNRKPMNVSN